MLVGARVKESQQSELLESRLVAFGLEALYQSCDTANSYAMLLHRNSRGYLEQCQKEPASNLGHLMAMSFHV